MVRELTYWLASESGILAKAMFSNGRVLSIVQHLYTSYPISLLKLYSHTS